MNKNFYFQEKLKLICKLSTWSSQTTMVYLQGSHCETAIQLLDKYIYFFFSKWIIFFNNNNYMYIGYVTVQEKIKKLTSLRYVKTLSMHRC